MDSVRPGHRASLRLLRALCKPTCKLYVTYTLVGHFLPVTHWINNHLFFQTDKGLLLNYPCTWKQFWAMHLPLPAQLRNWGYGPYLVIQTWLVTKE